ncbi:hypothetical protein [Lysobacter gummosus]|uniref:hypothetical protein n=1 Tax=Lysobacter gummosus TaxID=262324 RepID=UPI003638523E
MKAAHLLMATGNLRRVARVYGLRPSRLVRVCTHWRQWRRPSGDALTDKIGKAARKR